MNPFKNTSLALRISVFVAAFLAIAGAITGATIYEKVRGSLKEDLTARCMARIAALQAAMEVEDGLLDLEEMQSPLSAPGSDLGASSWYVATRDGIVLWSRNWKENDKDAVTMAKAVVIGERGDAAAQTASIKRDANSGAGRTKYVLPLKAKNIELRISASASNTQMNAELSRLALALWTVGPIAVLAAAGLVTLFVRWQLGPLTDMARQASVIGPENVVARIAPAGGSIECVRLSDAINRMVERLGEGLERERRFASIAAHELRTPLAQLRTGIEVALRRERTAEDYHAALKECLLDVERLQALVTSLLLLTRNQDDASCGREQVRLDRVITQAIRTCASKAILEPAAHGAMQVQGNEELLTCALRNVLENAERYAPGEPARITVTDNDDGAGIIVSVSDSGPGIPEQERERIFQPMVRLDLARTVGVKPDGFGLGLTVARAAAHGCGGTLTCCARADGRTGSEFRFRLKKPL